MGRWVWVEDEGTAVTSGNVGTLTDGTRSWPVYFDPHGWDIMQNDFRRDVDMLYRGMKALVAETAALTVQLTVALKDCDDGLAGQLIPYLHQLFKPRRIDQRPMAVKVLQSTFQRPRPRAVVSRGYFRNFYKIA